MKNETENNNKNNNQNRLTGKTQTKMRKNV